jgi:serine/threonine-protein kinase
MPEPHDPFERTVDLPPSDEPSLEAGLAAGFGPDSGPPIPAGASVLRALGASLPRVLLRDPEGETVTPVGRPGSAEKPPPEATGRYQLLGEIARGGMGAVFKGRDADLGRDVAVKVLLEAHAGRTELAQRFVEEAQIAGQLQHPNVVPVYELGLCPDYRPYFAMKLVKGRTLAALLRERPGPARDRPRFLAIFQQVCRAVAYAHAKGVVHRDLKPSNVMVGSFGEVQVMDWGLAKVLPRGGAADEAPPGDATVIRTARSEGSGTPAGVGSGTQAGRVLGTPAYMSPEQARGETARLDERCDVFGLGAILCEVLTGRPPYAGGGSELYRRAADGDLADAFARLDGCGADAELVGLAERCLAAEPGGRPRDARAVEAELTAYLESVERRLRAAEVGRAEAQVRAAEERKRRRVQLALAATMLMAVGGSAAGGLWYQRDRAERAAARAEAEERVGAAEAEAGLLQGQGRLAEAQAAAGRAAALAADDRVSPERRERAAGLAAALEGEAHRAEADRRLLDRLLDVRRPREATPARPAGTNLAAAAEPDADEEFAAAFRDWGLDVDTALAAEAESRLGDRPAAVRAGVAAALDEWAEERRQKGRPEADWRRLAALAGAVDPDPRHRELRALLAGDGLRGEGATARFSAALLPLGRLAGLEPPGPARARLRELAGRPGEAEGPPLGVLLLARALREAGNDPEAERLLRAALADRPGEPALLHALGGQLEQQRRWPEATECYAAARAVRPELGVALAQALARLGRPAEGLAVLDRLTRLRPEAARYRSGRGCLLGELGRYPEAEAEFREALRLRPDLPEAHNNLGSALAGQGRHKEAEAEFREALRLLPGYAEAHSNLGDALADQGRHAEAEAECRAALRLEPDLPEAHNNLGSALAGQGRHKEAEAQHREALRLRPEWPDAQFNLGNALHKQGRLKEAVAAFREALRLKPDYAAAYVNLASTLADQDRFAEAEAACRAALRLQPDSPEALGNLGDALLRQGRPREAEAEFREALRLKPNDPLTHNNLGSALLEQGRHAEAEAAFRAALRLRPDHAVALCNLGEALRRQGRFAESLAEYRRGHELGSRLPGWPYPSAAWVRRAERQADLERRLPGVLAGTDSPAGAAEAAALAGVALAKGLTAAAARLFADSFTADPRLAADLRTQDRYNAACAAALAADGKGADADRFPAKGRAGLRRQALAWLTADLAAWARLADNALARPALLQTLRHWQTDPDLAGVRDPTALAGLPEAERAAWAKLWADVAALLAKSGGPG